MTAPRDERIGPAWAGKWRERVFERVRARGFESLTAFLESRPTAPLVDLADELADPGGAERCDVAADQLARIWREEALTGGAAGIERLARRALVGELHRQLPSGWSAEWKGADLSRATHVMGSWSSILPQDAHESAFATYQVLLHDRKIPIGWLPSGPDDPILARAFASAWKGAPRSSGERTFTFEEGDEFAPDSPWGAEQLVLSRSGRFTYERRHRGSAVRSCGQVDPAIVQRLEELMTTAGFPEIPRHRIPPGASAVTLTVVEPNIDPIKLTFHRYFAAKVPGYRKIVESLSALNAALRSSDPSQIRAAGFVLDPLDPRGPGPGSEGSPSQ